MKAKKAKTKAKAKKAAASKKKRGAALKTSKKKAAAKRATAKKASQKKRAAKVGKNMKVSKKKRAAVGKDTRKEQTPDLADTQRLTPYLLYRDVGPALDWLAQAFGFLEYGDRFEGPDGTIQHAAMRTARNGEVFMMGCPGQDYQNPKLLGTSTQLMYITVDAVDKHFARAEQAGAEILERLTDTFYGDRRYTARDPEGHQWAFAQHIREVPVAEMKEAMKG